MCLCPTDSSIRTSRRAPHEQRSAGTRAGCGGPRVRSAWCGVRGVRVRSAWCGGRAGAGAGCVGCWVRRAWCPEGCGVQGACCANVCACSFLAVVGRPGCIRPPEISKEPGHRVARATCHGVPCLADIVWEESAQRSGTQSVLHFIDAANRDRDEVREFLVTVASEPLRDVSRSAICRIPNLPSELEVRDSGPSSVMLWMN